MLSKYFGVPVGVPPSTGSRSVLSTHSTLLPSDASTMAVKQLSTALLSLSTWRISLGMAMPLCHLYWLRYDRGLVSYWFASLPLCRGLSDCFSAGCIYDPIKLLATPPAYAFWSLALVAGCEMHIVNPEDGVTPRPDGQSGAPSPRFDDLCSTLQQPRSSPFQLC